METHTLTEEEMPSHMHFVVADEAATTFNALTSSNYIAKSYISRRELDYELGGVDDASEGFIGLSSATGGDKAHTNLQPYIVMYHIIYTGITS